MSQPPASTPHPWLFGPLRDLFLGCGLVYAVAFLALGIDGNAVRSLLPMSLTPLLVLVTSLPHYGATLWRVYAHAADRRRYVVFSGFVTLALAAAFVAGVYEPPVGSGLVTLYLTWSPWHYSGQNYGIALMFLRRRGVAVSAAARRCLHASFVASFLLTAVMLHAAGGGVSYAPGEHDGTVYQLVRLGLPAPLVAVLMPVLALVWVATTLAAGWLLRHAGLRALLPSAALACSQALWFAVPALARHGGVFQGFEPLGSEHAVYAFLWVAVAHAVQYLWITAYYQKTRRGLWSARVLLAGAAVWVLPALMFAPALLGRVPYDAGLGLLVAAVVNLHHFVLDGAIWKLRDGQVARILLRGEAGERVAPAPRRWPSRLVWALGTASVLVWCASTLEQAYGLEQALSRGDLPRIERAQERLRWLGQESARVHIALAVLHQQRGDPARARAHAERGLALHPGPDALYELAGYHHLAGQGALAVASLEQALALRPGSRAIRHRLAFFLLTYQRQDPGAARRALELAAAVAAESGDNPTHLHTLALAQAATGDTAGALASAQRGLRSAQREGQPALVDLLSRHVQAYTQALGR